MADEENWWDRMTRERLEQQLPTPETSPATGTRDWWEMEQRRRLETAGRAAARDLQGYSLPPPQSATSRFVSGVLDTGRTILDRGFGEAARGAYRAGGDIVDVVTGRKSDPQYKDTPELGTAGGPLTLIGDDKTVGALDRRGLKILAGTLFAREPNALADIVLETLPGSTVKKDRDGNPIITWNGRDYYVNKPGFSNADATKFFGDLMTLAPVFRAASAMPGLLGRAAVSGAGSSVASVGRDVVTGALGGKEEHGLSPGDIGKYALLEGGIGALTQAGVDVAPAVGRLIGIGGKPAQLTDAQLIAKGRELAEKAGLTPDAYHPEQLKSLASWADKVPADRLNETIRVVAANMREDPAGPLKGFRLTKGQRTGNEQVLKDEAVTRAGARGTTGQIALQIAEADRLQAIRDAARDLTGGGRPEAGFGSTMLSGVQKADEAGRTGYGALYKDAENYNLLFTPQSLDKLKRDLDKGFSDWLLSDTLTPATKGAIAHVKEQVSKTLPKVGGELPSGAPPHIPIPRAMSLREIDLIRQEVSGLPIANAKDAAGIYRVRKILDDWMDDAAANATPKVRRLGEPDQPGLPLFPSTIGDQPAVDALKKARDAFSQHKQKFAAADTSDRAGKTIESWLENGLTGQQVVDGVFGAGELSSRGNTVAMVDRLNRIFGAGSQYMQGVQDAAVTRILYGPRPTGDITDVGAGALASRIRRQLQGEGKEAFDALFPGAQGEEKRRALLQFADHLEATTKSGRGGVPGLSTSGTDVGTEALKRNLAKFVPGAGRLLDRFFGGEAAGRRISKEALGSTTGDIVRELVQGPFSERVGRHATVKAGQAARTLPQTPGLQDPQVWSDYYDQMFGP